MKEPCIVPSKSHVAVCSHLRQPLLSFDDTDQLTDVYGIECIAKCIFNANSTRQCPLCRRTMAPQNLPFNPLAWTLTTFLVSEALCPLPFTVADRIAVLGKLQETIMAPFELRQQLPRANAVGGAFFDSFMARQRTPEAP